jgi:outer membrane lipoprotein LolB
MSAVGWAARSAACCLVATLSACAVAPRADLPSAPGDVLRTGRLALSVQDQPGQSFSAGFELRGQPAQGELILLNPLGGTIAALHWRPGSATLQSPGREPQQFASLEAMVEQATGASMPGAALFDGLAGVATPVPGWEPDLTGLADGRLRARRTQPPPEADLRVVLDR